MFYIAEETIERFIKEDIPYIDLTTLVLDIGREKGEMSFVSRDSAVICGTEEVVRIFSRLGIVPLKVTPSGESVVPGETFIRAKGPAHSLHMAWKVSMNILEYYSAIATRTKRLVDRAKAVNPKVEVVATRKMCPGTKEFAVKAVVVGGGLPHRLGLSETVLLFKQHVNFMGGLSGLLNKIQAIKDRACEKKVVVEVDCREDAIQLASAGVGGIQFDKLSTSSLKSIVEEIREINPLITLIATGGINEGNVQEYAATGVDSISTSSIYFGKPVDIGVTINGI
ncbi:molybdenum transport protein [Anaerobacterium chartisolvens]|uniref:Putative pyrophosphorylase ModD n=1 Tax=Anaerobacterium chartisolvens TaxID=1297424 RepID=A0A369BK54_9FIRM|nr:ModD protein [Anaerobacterium chartisolvens]RCX20956.1 molybdenum transport protein [Anaerobacterium chartisolvens]